MAAKLKLEPEDVAAARGFIRVMERHGYAREMGVRKDGRGRAPVIYEVDEGALVQMLEILGRGKWDGTDAA